MIYGLYQSAQGAEAQSFRQDIIANNLANGSTTGFKRDLAVFQAHHPYDVENGITRDVPGNLNESSGGLSLAEVATDFSSASLVTTGNTFDVAVVGSGFLSVTDGQQNFLTRNGQLARNPSGDLVLRDSGHAVLGSGGQQINIPAEVSTIEFASDGRIFGVSTDGIRSELGQLDLVVPDSLSSLQKQGDSLYLAYGGTSPAGSDVQLKQGFLESSGTQPVTEMLGMIEASRAFEANVNMIKFQDEALARLLQSIAPK